ncbi:hypothetical protein MUO98_03870 [Candidatus Bathyarchaeota archaeon]|nr:hypothetical protein [Candidatus Bathyarchaeota archaeon]
MLFALFALVCECTAVAGAVLFPLFDFFGFLSYLFKGVSVYDHFESAVGAYEESVFVPC